LRSKLKTKAFLVIIAAVIFYSITIFISDISQVGTYLSLLDWRYFLLIFPLIIANLIIRGYRYDIILRTIDLKLGFSNSILIYISGLSMLLTPGGIGSIIKSHILKQKTGKSYSSTTPAIIYEKWLEILSNIIIIGIFLFWIDFFVSKIVFIVGLVITSVMFLFLKRPSTLGFLTKFMYKFEILKKYALDLDKFHESASALISPQTIAKTLSLTLIGKFAIIAAVFFVFQSFSLDFDFFSVGQIYFTSMTLGVLALIPGGILVVESSLLGLLVASGLEFSKASALVLVIRLVTLWFAILLGFTILKIVMNRKISNEN